MTPNNQFSRLRLRALLVSGVAGGLLTLALPAGATLARAVSFDEKVASADSIVLGRCLRTESKFDPSGKWVVTYSTFAVEKSFKGDGPGEMTLVTPGGKINGLHQRTVGIPEFEQGDAKVLFVKGSILGPSVLFFDQGTYELAKDARGETTVAPIESAAVLLDSQTGKVTRSEEPIRTLRRFEQDIASSLRRTGGKQIHEFSAAGAQPEKRATSVWQETVEFARDNKLVLSLVALGLLIAMVQLLRSK